MMKDEDEIKEVKYEGQTSDGKYLLYSPQSSKSNKNENDEIDKDKWYVLIIS